MKIKNALILMSIMCFSTLYTQNLEQTVDLIKAIVEDVEYEIVNHNYFAALKKIDEFNQISSSINNDKISIPVLILTLNLKDQIKKNLKIDFKDENGIHWLSLDKAMKLQNKDPKKIIIKTDFDGYPASYKIHRLIYKNALYNQALVNHVNTNYYAIKLNYEDEENVIYKNKTYTTKQIIDKLKIKPVCPLLTVLDEKGDLINTIEGFKGLKHLEKMLVFYTENKYKEIITQDDFDKYYNNYKNKF